MMSDADLIARMENIEALVAGRLTLAEARRRLAEIMRRQDAPALDEDEDGNGHGLH